jgi:hypothetical protein
MYILLKCTQEITFENECLSGPCPISGLIGSVQSARERENKTKIKITKQ